jgi:hypothetical protein
VRTGGIDLAAQPENTALCVIQWDRGAASVLAVSTPVTDADIRLAFEGVDKLGVDVPLG